MTAELSDPSAVDRLFEGVDACVHLGGHPVEAPWETVIQSNILGVINTWEAARKAGTKRIIFASSNHAIGFHPRSRKLDHRSPARPDSRYGLSKAFGEDVALYYANKHGISAMCLRIGSWPGNTARRTGALDLAKLPGLLPPGRSRSHRRLRL